MNLTLYAITAFIILDTDGNRVLSKYYRQENNPSSSKGLANTKEQRAFEKGLWQKTKKSGGQYAIIPPSTRLTTLADIPTHSGSIPTHTQKQETSSFMTVASPSTNTLSTSSST